jgi:SAM-dependent methyltransferase
VQSYAGSRYDSRVQTLRGYPVTHRPIRLGEFDWELLGPANYESLLDDPRVVARFQRDEYMPYWAEFWPASLLLAQEVLGWPRAGEPSPTALEIGCGLGLVSLAALARGYRVIASDYDDDALAFVRENALRNGLPPPETRFIDWRERYADLRLDRILAAEILYETRSIRPIAEFLHAHLADDGVALIVDSNRSTADAFDSIARHCGLRVACRPVQGLHPATGAPMSGRIFEARRKS